MMMKSLFFFLKDMRQSRLHIKSRFSSFFFLAAFTSESGNLLTYMKNIHFLSSLERPMETSWRNTASRHRDNVHVYDK